MVLKHQQAFRSLIERAYTNHCTNDVKHLYKLKWTYRQAQSFIEIIHSPNIDRHHILLRTYTSHCTNDVTSNQIGLGKEPNFMIMSQKTIGIDQIFSRSFRFTSILGTHANGEPWAKWGKDNGCYFIEII